MLDVLLETYTINDAMNQLLLAHLDPSSSSAQKSALVAQELCAAPETSGTDRFRPLHDEASRDRSQEERNEMPPHTHRRLGCQPQAPRHKILARHWAPGWQPCSRT